MDILIISSGIQINCCNFVTFCNFIQIELQLCIICQPLKGDIQHVFVAIKDNVLIREPVSVNHALNALVQIRVGSNGYYIETVGFIIEQMKMFCLNRFD